MKDGLVESLRDSAKGDLERRSRESPTLTTAPPATSAINPASEASTSVTTGENDETSPVAFDDNLATNSGQTEEQDEEAADHRFHDTGITQDDYDLEEAHGEEEMEKKENAKEESGKTKSVHWEEKPEPREEAFV